jgi:hypothetical protein
MRLLQQKTTQQFPDVPNFSKHGHILALNNLNVEELQSQSSTDHWHLGKYILFINNKYEHVYLLCY